MNLTKIFRSRHICEISPNFKCREFDEYDDLGSAFLLKFISVAFVNIVDLPIEKLFAQQLSPRLIVQASKWFRQKLWRKWEKSSPTPVVKMCKIFRQNAWATETFAKSTGERVYKLSVGPMHGKRVRFRQNLWRKRPQSVSPKTMAKANVTFAPTEFGTLIKLAIFVIACIFTGDPSTITRSNSIQTIHEYIADRITTSLISITGCRKNRKIRKQYMAKIRWENKPFASRLVAIKHTKERLMKHDKNGTKLSNEGNGLVLS